ncbi:C40 family peptidase, partial [bacterium]|nr:C40 family peptidase [bacterium]
GVDGDGDGVADPTNFRDCLPAAAAYLLASGAPGDMRQALYAYNHSWTYVDHVLSIAASYGYLDPAGIPAQAVAVATSKIGSPYVWGAAGPDTFDCSGLVQWVYGQLGIATPRTSQAQYDWATPVSVDAMQPGDLVFYEHTYPSSERITHVGIYTGGGLVVMAPQTGEFVKEVAFNDPYWASHFAGVGRPHSGGIQA